MRAAGVKLIGPMDLVPDNKLQDMGDAAIGTLIMTHYGRLRHAGKQGVREGLAGKPTARIPIRTLCRRRSWDTMAGIFDTIKKTNGKVEGEKFVDALKNWKGVGPRGSVSIDPATRDIVQDEHAATVYRKADGKLGIKSVDVRRASRTSARRSKISAAAP